MPFQASGCTVAAPVADLQAPHPTPRPGYLALPLGPPSTLRCFLRPQASSARPLARGCFRETASGSVHAEVSSRRPGTRQQQIKEVSRQVRVLTLFSNRDCWSQALQWGAVQAQGHPPVFPWHMSPSLSSPRSGTEHIYLSVPAPAGKARCAGQLLTKQLGACSPVFATTSVTAADQPWPIPRSV